MAVSSEDKLYKQVKQSYGRIVWTNKIHEKTADILMKRYRVMQVISWSLSALTSGTLIVIVFEQSKIGAIIGAILGTLAVLTQSYLNYAKLVERANEHKSHAVKYWDIREKYISLLVDSENLSKADFIERRDKLQSRTMKVHETAPRTTEKAYDNATTALNEKGEENFSDDSLGEIIPKFLEEDE